MGFGLLACESSSLTGLRFEAPMGQLRVDADLKLGQWMIVGWYQDGKHTLSLSRQWLLATRGRWHSP